MESFSSVLVSSAAQLTPIDALRSKPSILLGVSAAAEAALVAIGINSVFDLALSRIFANANLILDASSNPQTVLARYGMAPSDVVESIPGNLTLEDLALQSPALLEGIGAAYEATITAALEVATIRDLALWPPFRAARSVLAAAFAPEFDDGVNLEAPRELLPVAGDFPTERVFYSTLVFDGFEGDHPPLTPVEALGQIDISPSVMPNFGFERQGVGALLTVSIMLSQVLYSGYLAVPSWGISIRKAQHEALISLETYRSIQAIVQGDERVSTAPTSMRTSLCAGM